MRKRRKMAALESKCSGIIAVVIRRCVYIGALLAAILLPAEAGAIVGGRPAQPAQFDFTVAVRQKKRFICTGSVVAPKIVLTAAHCARSKGHGKLRVVAGRRHIHAGKTGQIARVAAVDRFPSYRKNERHDLSLLYLDAPVAVPPIAIATGPQADELTRPGAQLFIAGYGDRRPLFTEAAKFGRLTWGIERIRPYRRCRRPYGRRGFRADTMLCALGRPFGPKRIGATSCSGDSGGPLFAITPTGYLLLGVTSFGSGAGNVACGAPFTPSVYARVTRGMSFIHRNVPPLATAP